MTEVTLVSIDQLPAWATEKTLNSLVRYFKENKGMDESTAKKLADAVDNLGKNTKETSEKLEEVADELGKIKDGGADTGPRGAPKEETKKTEKQMGVFRSTLRGLTSDSADLAKSLISNVTGFESSSRYLYGFNRAIEDATKESGKLKKALGSTLMGAVGIAASAFGMLVKVVMDHANVMLKMNEFGLRGITTTQQLNRNLTELAMTSSEFQDIMSRFSTVMGTFGEKSLADLIGSSTEFNDRLRKLGLTTADAAEFAAEYLQQQRLSGIFERIDNHERRKAFHENLRNLSAFSTMLNVSRQDIAKTQTEFLRQDRIRAVLLQDSTGRASSAMRQMVGFFAGFGDTGKAVIEMLGDMASVADPTMALDNYSIALAAAPEAIMGMMETVRGVRSGAIDEEEAIRRSARFNMDLANNADRLSRIAQLTGDQFTARLASQAMAQRELISRLRQNNMTEDQIRRELVKRAETEARIVESAAGFNDMLNRTRRLFEGFVMAFFSSFFGDQNKIDDQFGSMLDYVTKKGEEFGNKILEIVGDEKTPGGLIKGLFSAIWKLISPGINSIVSYLLDGLVTVGGFIVGGMFSAVRNLIEGFKEILSETKIFGVRLYKPEDSERRARGREQERQDRVNPLKPRVTDRTVEERRPQDLMNYAQLPDPNMEYINAGIVSESDIYGTHAYDDMNEEQTNQLNRILTEQKEQQELQAAMTQRLVEATERSQTMLANIETNTARN